MFSKSRFRRRKRPKQNNWLESSNKENSFIPPIQTKLNIGKPGDVYEQEADRAADQVVNDSPDSPEVQKMEEEQEEVQTKRISGNITPFVQKQEEPQEEPVQAMEEEEPVQAMEEEEPVQAMEEEEPVQAMEEEEPVQAMEEEEPVQAMEEEEPVQAMEEEEPVQAMEEEEPVQAMEEEEPVQAMEEEEPVQAMEEEEPVQTMEEEEPVQAMEEEEPVQAMEEEEPVQAMEEEEPVQTMEEEEPVQAMEEEEPVQAMEEEEPVQAKEEEEEPVQAMEEEEPVQAKEEEEEPVQQKSKGRGHSNKNIESKLSTHRGGGHSMDIETKGEMESSFGNDFSNVRIHTGGYAQDMSKDLKAKAFTNGHDIYFNSSQYKPQSKDGKHLLAHELTHTIQQKGGVQKKEATQDISSTNKNVQGGFFGNVWRGVKRAGRAVGSVIGSGARAVGGAIAGAVGGAFRAATSFLGGSAAWALAGLRTLGAATLRWLANAKSEVWKAIAYLGPLAWKIIKTVGIIWWKRLVVLGINVWSFIKNAPIRYWRIILQLWNGIIGPLKWIGKGLWGVVKHFFNAIVGTFTWLGKGFLGLLGWLGRGLVGGFKWAIDFIQSPSRAKLWKGITDSITWIGDGVKGLLKWGWQGFVGILVWAATGVVGTVKWLWDGIKGGLTWIGTLLMQLLDFYGAGEALQIIWGLKFNMRKLTAAEIAASKTVHPAGMIPYYMIRVDEDSLISKIGRGAAVTTMHIIHVPRGGISISTMVHELTHVAQYEHVGSVYMPEAGIAQMLHGSSGGRGSGSAYDYEREGTLAQLIAAKRKFSDFNRESQAELVQDYYNIISGGGTSANHLHFIRQMQRGEF